MIHVDFLLLPYFVALQLFTRLPKTYYVLLQIFRITFASPILLNSCLNDSTIGAYNLRIPFNISTPSGVNANSSNSSEYATAAASTATLAVRTSSLKSSIEKDSPQSLMQSRASSANLCEMDEQVQHVQWGTHLFGFFNIDVASWTMKLSTHLYSFDALFEFPRSNHAHASPFGQR